MVLVPAPLAASWAEALLTAAPQGRLVGFSAFEEARIRAGMPSFGVDYGPDHLPAEAGLYDRVSFNKGCYVGQEVHARLHHRGHVNRKLIALEIPPEEVTSLAPGRPLYANGAAVGEVTSLARAPEGDLVRGIAMVRYRQAADRSDLSAAPSSAPRIRQLPLATDLGAART